MDLTAQTQSRARFHRAIGDMLMARNCRLIVVGGSGWLGMATLEMLQGLFGAQFPKRVFCFGSSERELVLRSGRVKQASLSSLSTLKREPSIVLHLAFLTRDKVSTMPLEEYLRANRAISGTVLDALDAIGAEGVFVPSSGAVYGVLEGQSESQNPYGALKLEDEARFGAWATRSNQPAVIARVFNLSGPYINKRSLYALGSFISDALRGQPIAIQAQKQVFRSYVAIEELMSVVFSLLLQGKPGPTLFDTAGENVVEVGELAGLVQDAMGRSQSVQRPPLGDLPPDRYVGNGELYQTLRRAAGVPSISLKQQILTTARFIANEVGDASLLSAAVEPSHPKIRYTDS